MEEPVVRRFREAIGRLIERGGDRAAIRSEVYQQIIGVFGAMQLTPTRVQRIVYAAMEGILQAAEDTQTPIELVGEEGVQGILLAVKAKGGQGSPYVRAAVRGGIAALEAYRVRLQQGVSKATSDVSGALRRLRARFKSFG